MLEYVEGNIGINGVKIHYYRTGGNKPPFIRMHTKGAGHNIRREQFEVFCEKLFDFLKGLPD